jgi:hypothetical protein
MEKQKIALIRKTQLQVLERVLPPNIPEVGLNSGVLTLQQ